MHLALDLAFAFLVLGVVEAFIKPLAQWFVERRLRAALPRLFEILDPLMPGLIAQYTPGELEKIVRAHLTEITGDDWSSENVDGFFAAYDPRVNAARINTTTP